MFLQTRRLQLRHLKPTDADVIYDYRNNEICARYQRGQTKDYAGIVELIQKRMLDVLDLEEPCMLAVALKDTDEPVGEIVVMPNEGTISLGYTFSYRHHRQGYAFEALSALIAHLHSRYPQWDFVSFVEPDNIASRRLLEKLGYTDLGYLPRLRSQAYGNWLTTVTWQELRQAAQMPEPPTVIELRQRTEEHVRVYFERTGDAEIAAMLPRTADSVEAALESFRKTRLPDATSFGRTIYADGHYVGDAWCYCIDPADNPNAMLSYCIFEKAVWGRGVATAALELFLDEIRKRFALNSVGAFAYCGNVPSRRVLEKLGFWEMERFTEDGIESSYWERRYSIL